MDTRQPVFAQLMEFLPRYDFQQCVQRYKGQYKIKSFSCWDQFLCMAFAQLTYRESLRDIEACLRSAQHNLYHMGFRGKVSRNTLAHANEVRDWRIYADFAQILIGRARRLYANDSFGVELDQTAYALDSTLIDLCLSLFPWAKFRKRKGAIKLHTLLDLRGSIPSLIIITHGKIHDVTILDQLTFEPGAFYIFDRGYLDFARLHKIHQASSILCDPSQKQFPVQTPLFSTGRQIPRRSMRPNHCPQGILRQKGLSRQIETNPLFRCHPEQMVRFPNQQLYTARFDHRSALSLPMADRIVLQMDQAASSNQSLLWHNRQCRQDPDLDRHHGLCAGGHRQKATETGKESLHNSTDFERYSFRKKPHFRGLGKR